MAEAAEFLMRAKSSSDETDRSLTSLPGNAARSRDSASARTSSASGWRGSHQTNSALFALETFT